MNLFVENKIKENEELTKTRTNKFIDKFGNILFVIIGMNLPLFGIKLIYYVQKKILSESDIIFVSMGTYAYLKGIIHLIGFGIIFF